MVFQGLKLEYTKREFFISTSPGDSTQIHNSDQFLHQLLLSLHHHLVGEDCHLVPGLAEEPPLGPLDQGGPSAVSASRENEDRHTVADLNDTKLVLKHGDKLEMELVAIVINLQNNWLLAALPNQ